MHNLIRPRNSLRFLLLLVSLIVVSVVDHQSEIRSLPIKWNVSTGENVKWSVPLGSLTYSSPTVHGEFVFVGTNNGNGYDPAIPSSAILGVMLCLEKETGKFLWQLSNKGLPAGRSSDWPVHGVTSQAFADKNRLWYVNNRGEVVCLDVDGFYDGENDGPFRNEPSSRKIDADIVWKVDMIKTFGVSPHKTAHCNVVVDDQRVYVKTSNGVGLAHIDLPAPNAPRIVVLDRATGQTIWTENSSEHIMHGSWGSPTLATIAGKRQILFSGGDGWLYSFDPAGDGHGKPVLLWKFDCNFKTAIRGAGAGAGALGTRNMLLAAPTVRDGKVFVAPGQDPEHGSGLSQVWCIDPGSKRGDISPTLVKLGQGSKGPSRGNGFQHCDLKAGDKEIPNPNSGLAWCYTGADSNGDGVIDESDTPHMARSLSEVRVQDGFAFVTDMNGFVHCIDAKTGKPVWHFNCIASIWSSPLLSDSHVYVGTEDGEVVVLEIKQNPSLKKPTPVATNITPNYGSVYANMSSSDGVIYIASRSELTAVYMQPKKPKGK